MFLLCKAPDGLDADFQYTSKDGDRVTRQDFLRRRNDSAKPRSVEEMFGD